MTFNYLSHDTKTHVGSAALGADEGRTHETRDLTSRRRRDAFSLPEARLALHHTGASAVLVGWWEGDMKSAQMRMFAVALLVHAGCGDNPVVEKEGQPWQQRPQHWAPAGTLSFSRTNIVTPAAWKLRPVIRTARLRCVGMAIRMWPWVSPATSGPSMVVWPQ